MIVGVTGASGFIGRQTVQLLKESGHDVRKFVRREVKNDDEIYWSPAKKEIDIEKFQELDAILHLAGESIAPQEILGFLPFAGGRWSKERKSRIYWSRKWASDLFVETFKNSDKFPSIFITASGNDIYGDHGDEIVTEDTSFNRGQFLQMVAEECWEEPLYEIEKLGVRVLKCRSGIVLGKGNIATQIFTLITKLNNEHTTEENTKVIILAKKNTNKLRLCETIHSDPINEIFFVTLDEIDCLRDPFTINF